MEGKILEEQRDREAAKSPSLSLSDQRQMSALLGKLRSMQAEHRSREEVLLQEIVEANGRRDDHETGFRHKAELCPSCAAAGE